MANDLLSAEHQQRGVFLSGFEKPHLLMLIGKFQYDRIGSQI